MNEEVVIFVEVITWWICSPCQAYLSSDEILDIRQGEHSSLSCIGCPATRLDRGEHAGSIHRPSGVPERDHFRDLVPPKRKPTPSMDDADLMDEIRHLGLEVDRLQNPPRCRRI
jgi:hypothetical protein